MGRLRVVASVFWAVSALLVGHEIAYHVSFTDAATRAHVLDHSGHGWLGLLAPVAVMATITGFVASVLVGRSGRTGRRFAFGVHAATQVGAYLAIELGERLLSGHGVSGVAAEFSAWSGVRLLLIGVVAQLLCAAVVSLLSRTAEVLGAAVVRRDAVRAVPVRVLRPGCSFLTTQFLAAGLGSRGPPVSAGTAVLAS